MYMHVYIVICKYACMQYEYIHCNMFIRICAYMLVKIYARKHSNIDEHGEWNDGGRRRGGGGRGGGLPGREVVNIFAIRCTQYSKCRLIVCFCFAHVS